MIDNIEDAMRRVAAEDGYSVVLSRKLLLGWAASRNNEIEEVTMFPVLLDTSMEPGWGSRVNTDIRVVSHLGLLPCPAKQWNVHGKIEEVSLGVETEGEPHDHWNEELASAKADPVSYFDWVFRSISEKRHRKAEEAEERALLDERCTRQARTKAAKVRVQ